MVSLFMVLSVKNAERTVARVRKTVHLTTLTALSRNRKFWKVLDASPQELAFGQRDKAEAQHQTWVRVRFTEAQGGPHAPPGFLPLLPPHH